MLQADEHILWFFRDIYFFIFFDDSMDVADGHMIDSSGMEVTSMWWTVNCPSYTDRLMTNNDDGFSLDSWHTSYFAA